MKLTPRSYLLADLLWSEVHALVEAGWTRVMIPCGAQEAHGATGLATDTIIPSGLADYLAPRLDSLIAPPMPYGLLRSLTVYPGSVSFSENTYQQVMLEIAEGLVRTGFHELLFINGHSGNRGVLKDVAWKIHLDGRAKALVYDWYSEPHDLTYDFYDGPGGHSGAGETAMVTAFQPEAAPENLWKKDEADALNPAINAYPGPYPIILMEAEKGLPDHDPEKATQFMNAVVDVAEKSIQSVLKRWSDLSI